jgi:predicted ABC-type ATPase
MLGVVMPKVVVIAGPNGAGKSTAAPAVLRNALLVNEFVNADTIAHAAGIMSVNPADSHTRSKRPCTAVREQHGHSGSAS